MERHQLPGQFFVLLLLAFAMLTSPTSETFCMVWYQNQHLYFADVIATSSEEEEEEEEEEESENISKITISFISPDSGTLCPFYYSRR